MASDLAKALADAMHDEAVEAAKRVARQQAERPGSSRIGDEIEVSSDISEDRHPDIPAMMERYRLDPDVWEPCSDPKMGPVVNRWEVTIKQPDGPMTLPLWQFKVRFQKRFRGFDWARDLQDLFPWKPQLPRPESLLGKPGLYLVCSDLQIPYHDPILHELTCELAHDLKVDRWYDLGDECDLPTISRWQKRRPRYDGDENFYKSAKETRDIARTVFNERTTAAPPHCELHLVDSNHGERWDTYLNERVPDIADILPNFRDLIGLPAMGWEVHLSNYGSGTYQMAEVLICPGDGKSYYPAIGIHGFAAKGNAAAGQSVMQELLHRESTCVFQGHCNHFAHVQYTRGGIGERRHRVDGWEVGMLGQYRMAFGDRKVKDWQKGLHVVTAWPDGSYEVEGVPYYDDVEELRFRGNVYTLKRPKHVAGHLEDA